MCAIHRSDFGNSKKLFINIMNEENKKQNSLYEKALLAMEKRQFDYAIALFQTILSEDSNFTKAGHGLDLARKAKREEVKNSSQAKLAAIRFLIKAYIFENAKRWEKAIKNYEDFLNISYPTPQVLLHLGNCYQKISNTGNAINTYRKVLETDRENAASLKKLSQIYIDQKKLEDAKANLGRYIKLIPNDSWALENIKNIEAQLAIRDKFTTD